MGLCRFVILFRSNNQGYPNIHRTLLLQVVSGTPGRVFDMIRRKNLRTRNIKVI